MRVAHGGGPGAGKIRGLPVAVLQYLEGGDELLARILFFPPGIDECGEGTHHAHGSLVLAEIRLHAPDP